MKDEVITLTEAVRLATRELDAYLGDGANADPEVTLAKLVGILKRSEVTRAGELLSGSAESPPSVPEPEGADRHVRPLREVV